MPRRRRFGRFHFSLLGWLIRRGSRPHAAWCPRPSMSRAPLALRLMEPPQPSTSTRLHAPAPPVPVPALSWPSSAALSVADCCCEHVRHPWIGLQSGAAGPRPRQHRLCSLTNKPLTSLGTEDWKNSDDSVQKRLSKHLLGNIVKRMLQHDPIVVGGKGREDLIQNLNKRRRQAGCTHPQWPCLPPSALWPMPGALLRATRAQTSAARLPWLCPRAQPLPASPPSPLGPVLGAFPQPKPASVPSRCCR